MDWKSGFVNAANIAIIGKILERKHKPWICEKALSNCPLLFIRKLAWERGAPAPRNNGMICKMQTSNKRNRKTPKSWSFPLPGSNIHNPKFNILLLFQQKITCQRNIKSLLMTIE
jgi:hypothetical protein